MEGSARALTLRRETIYGSDYNDQIYALGGDDDIRADWGADKNLGRLWQRLYLARRGL